MSDPKWGYREGSYKEGELYSSGGEADKVIQGDGQNGYLIITGRDEAGNDEAPLIEFDRSRYTIERDAKSTERREIIRIIKK